MVRLYVTSLAPALRLDIPFIPHITVGATGEPTVTKAITDAVNLQEGVVEDVIDQLSLIRFDGRAVELCEQTVAVRQGETINRAALTAMLKQIIANNRAGGAGTA